MADFSLNGMDPKFYLDRLELPRREPAGKEGGDFAGFLSRAIDDVNQIQKSADEQMSKVIQGNVEDIHTAMIELQKANLSFQVMMEVRNKILEAYQEIMRTQI